MVWCSGYLTDKLLVTFLKKAKTRLLMVDLRQTRRAQPESFIILMDNVLEEGETREPVKGQRLRTEHELETIF